MMTRYGAGASSRAPAPTMNRYGAGGAAEAARAQIQQRMMQSRYSAGGRYAPGRGEGGIPPSLASRYGLGGGAAAMRSRYSRYGPDPDVDPRYGSQSRFPQPGNPMAPTPPQGDALEERLLEYTISIDVVKAKPVSVQDTVPSAAAAPGQVSYAGGAPTDPF